jgi:hypothetical protein
LPACCSQPVAGRVIYADLWGVLSTYLACLFRVLLCRSLCYRLSPFQALGKVTLPSCCQACVCIYSSHGKWVFLLSCGVFLPPPLSQAFPLLVGGRMPCSRQSLSGLPGLFIYSPGKDSFPPIFSAQGAPPSFQRVLIVLITYYSVSLFSPGWRSVCPGGYAALAQACLWVYRGTVKLTWSTCS